eukprot:g39812.t1
MDAVVFRPGPPVLQAITPSVSKGPSALFVYGSQLSTVPLQPTGSSVDGWVYGIRLSTQPNRRRRSNPGPVGPAGLAQPTGDPSDVVKGKLLMWNSAAFADQLRACDQLCEADKAMGYNHNKPSQGVVRRSVVKVVTEAGDSVEAYMFHEASSSSSSSSPPSSFPSSPSRASVSSPSGNLALAPRPPPVVLPVTPTVYIYDHCPFCLRVRLLLGLKNIKHKVVFMASDDVDTPTALVGKKIAPIFEMGIFARAMMDSGEIVNLLETDRRFGGQLLRPRSGRKDLEDFFKGASDLIRNLLRPRYVASPLPEFLSKAARETFISKHSLPPFDNAAWVAKSLPEQVALYQAAMKQ